MNERELIERLRNALADAVQSAANGGRAATPRQWDDAMRDAETYLRETAQAGANPNDVTGYLWQRAVAEGRTGKSAPEAVAAPGDDDLYLPCGHPASLKVSSVESDHWFCELCECRNELRDALTMEHALRDERDALAERLAAVERERDNAQAERDFAEAVIGHDNWTLALAYRNERELRDEARADRDRLAAALAQREGEVAELRRHIDSLYQHAYPNEHGPTPPDGEG